MRRSTNCRDNLMFVNKHRDPSVTSIIRYAHLVSANKAKGIRMMLWYYVEVGRGRRRRRGGGCLTRSGLSVKTILSTPPTSTLCSAPELSPLRPVHLILKTAPSIQLISSPATSPSTPRCGKSEQRRTANSCPCILCPSASGSPTRSLVCPHYLNVP